MTCFLTSMPIIDEESGAFADVNGFLTEMRAVLEESFRMLFICSDPDNYERTDFYSSASRTAFERSGFTVTEFNILDRRTQSKAHELVANADLIVLAGGHVPTQNRFFAEIGLKELLSGFDGVLMGISAGSMNSAETVYAQPECEGEAVDPGYERFFPGLGLTKTMLLPHYQDCKDDVLDGLRVFEDIAYPDSMGREFIAVPDGSYLLIENGSEELRGEYYLIKDGVISDALYGGKGDTIA